MKLRWGLLPLGLFLAVGLAGCYTQLYRPGMDTLQRPACRTYGWDYDDYWSSPWWIGVDLAWYWVSEEPPQGPPQKRPSPRRRHPQPDWSGTLSTTPPTAPAPGPVAKTDSPPRKDSKQDNDSPKRDSRRGR